MNTRKIKKEKEDKNVTIKRKLFQKDPSERSELPQKDDSNEECLYSSGPFRNNKQGESWIRCINRKKLCHGLCSDVGNWKTFECDFCKP